MKKKILKKSLTYPETNIQKRAIKTEYQLLPIYPKNHPLQ